MFVAAGMAGAVVSVGMADVVMSAVAVACVGVACVAVAAVTMSSMAVTVTTGMGAGKTHNGHDNQSSRTECQTEAVQIHRIFNATGRRLNRKSRGLRKVACHGKLLVTHLLKGIMRYSRLLGGIALASLATMPAAAQRPQGKANDAINIPFERYALTNGLNVVLAPDRSSPTVAVTVYYHVGSKNEVVGRTGFAHMFEHTMFTGSGHVPYGVHDRLTEGVGGGNNAFTTFDETVYYETVPSNYLESALWLESDRMGFLLDSLDSAKFIAQRDIVQNERRQSYDNRPYGRSREIYYAAMYPSSSSYSWPTIGYMTDLKQATVDNG